MRQFLNPEEFERFSGDGMADAFRRMDIGRDGMLTSKYLICISPIHRRAEI
jgi:hypothetical protein